MRFLADMGIAMETAEALRRLGHDVAHLSERGLARMKDPDIVALATGEQRVVLTHDLDFGRLLAMSRAGQPSLITFRLGNMTPASVTGRLLEAIGRFEADLADGAAVSVADSGIRCRRLPIQPSDPS